MQNLSRQVIYPKDVQVILGKSRYTAYRCLKQVRKMLNKSRKENVTITEFCKVMKMREEVVARILR